MIVYKATNKINLKIYIGVSKNKLNSRKSSHHYSAKNGSHYMFHAALMKYGFDNFKWEIIDRAKTKSDLLRLEVQYISKYNSFGSNGYNMTVGGEVPVALFGEKNGMFGKTHSKETKKRISDNLKGKTFIDRFGEHEANLIKKKMSKIHLGRKNSKETIDKMKKNSFWRGRGYLMTGENNGNFNKKWDESKKDKVRGNNNGMFENGHLVAGRNNGMFGKTHSKSSKNKMSIANLGRNNGNYRKIDTNKLNEIINTFKDNESIAKTAKIFGENYNKIKRELIFEGLI